MMATVRTSHGTYTGRSVGSILRREYGKRVVVAVGGDIIPVDEVRVAHDEALVVLPLGDAYRVEARLLEVTP